MRARIQKISRYAPSIFQGRLDFGQKGRGVSLTLEHPLERALWRVLIASVGLLAVLYLYFVGSSILNVIARKEAAAESQRLTSAVASLERDYYAFSEEIGPEDGSRLGLNPVAATEYIRRPGSAASLTIPSDEI